MSHQTSKKEGIMRKYMYLLMALCFIPGTLFAGDAINGAQSFTSDGSNVTVVNSVTYSGQISAIGLRVTAPAEWKFVSVSGKNIPGISPKEGASGVLEFAWIQPPPKTFSFEYVLTVPQGAVGDVNAEIIYRRDAGELTSPMLPNPLTVE
jgi:hypothetical protein